MRILFLGDIMGRPGRQIVQRRLAAVRRSLGADMVCANAENASGGLGLSMKSSKSLRGYGIDAMTSGNHIWKFRDIASVLNEVLWLLRPANYPQGAPGRGMGVYEVQLPAVASIAHEDSLSDGTAESSSEAADSAAPGAAIECPTVVRAESPTGVQEEVSAESSGGHAAADTPTRKVRVAVINLIGRTYMDPSVDCPFRKADALLAELPEDVKIRVIDFHAEATSEKKALAHYLDGRVSAVLGTHTHVQTADPHVLPGGTAVLTDLGMCGVAQSALGMDPQAIVDKFMTGLPQRFTVASGEASLQGAVLDVDPETGRAVSITNWQDAPNGAAAAPDSGL